MNLVDIATQFIALKYDRQQRTIMQIPYAIHLFRVARLLESRGDLDGVVTAGLLQDSLEDHIASEMKLAELFGPAVLVHVKATTELSKSYPWQTRKKRVIASLKEKSPEKLTILLAEKIHDVKGSLGNFNAPKEQQEWYDRNIIEQVEDNCPNTRLLSQFQLAVDKLFVNVAY